MKELNEAEEYHYKITGVKRRFHINSYLGKLWLRIKQESEGCQVWFSVVQ